MLPPHLSAIQDRLREKGHVNRSIEEDQFLDELDWLESLEGLDEAVRSATHRGSLTEARDIKRFAIIIDQGKCSCCGRS